MSKVKTALAVVAAFPVGMVALAGFYTWACVLTGDYDKGRAFYDSMEDFENKIK